MSGFMPALFWGMLLTSLSWSLQAADWREYQSENFIIYSDARQGRVEQILNDFEDFRSIARFFLNLGEQKEHARVRIYIFRSGREFQSFTGDNNIAGFYIDALGGPRLVIGSTRGMDYKATLFHEYVHYLMMSNTGYNYPFWYSEGMAELLSSAYKKFDFVAIGEVPEARISTLENYSRMPVAELIRLGSTEETSGVISQARLYAGAWLFTHFLTVGNFNDEHKLREPLLAYLQAYQQGLDPVESFPDIFAMNPEQMDNLLNAYVRGRGVPVLRFGSEPFIYKGEVTSKKIDADESAFLLASLAYDMGEMELAMKYLQEQEDAKRSARAAALLAVVAGYLENHILSDQQAEYAVQQTTLDEDALTFLSHYWLEYSQRHSQTEGPDVIERALQQALDYSVQAINKDDSYIEAYYNLARAMSAQGKLDDAENILWAAFDKYPGSLQVNTYMLMLQIFQEEYELALNMIKRLYGATHIIERRQQLDELRVAITEAAMNTTVTKTNANKNLIDITCKVLGC